MKPEQKDFPSPEAPSRNRPSAIPKQSLPGLYVHIPFCITKCPYCSFFSQTDLSLVPDFIEALGKEAERVAPDCSAPFDTIYIGGGTPSILTPEQIEKILENIRRFLPLSPSAEITLEANPGDADLASLEALRGMGIQRLSLGVQSFDSKVLSFLGRRHTVPQAVQAIEASRKAGFPRLALDLIYGIPGQSLRSWHDTLRKAMAFSPEHLSCYELTLDPETPLGKARRSGAFSCFGEEELLHFFLNTSESLEKAGFIHYEVSNFARGLRHASSHNQKYWDHTPYLGLGPAAHSFSGTSRRWNTPSVAVYVEALRSGNLPPGGEERLTPEQLRLEAWFLGLRIRKGIHIREFSEKYGEQAFHEKSKVLEKLQGEGLLVLKEGHLRPTRKGLALADRLARI